MMERTLSERYRLDHRIGEGGMAIVYSGMDTVLRRRVAVKVLRPQYAGDEEFVKRFYNEAEHAARVSHPNIVNIYDVGHQGESYFIVMELVEGATLAEMLRHDRLPESVAIDYAAQICSGLAYAHRQGLLHRDIKPANILVTTDDVVKISDFGIARAVSEHTMTFTQPGMVMGSVYYISPEQAQGHELRETSDLYSVGVVLYQMLTGKLPYTGDSPVAVALKHVSEPVPMVRAQDRTISPALASIVTRLLQKDPAARFASATDVATALREARERPLEPQPAVVSEQQQSAAGAPSTVTRVSKYPRRPADSDTALEDSPQFGRGGLLGVGLALLLIAGIAIGVAVVRRPGGLFGGPQTIGSYVGMSTADAERVLASVGLSYHVTLVPSEDLPPDKIVRQDPAAGTTVPGRSTIELFASEGPPIVDIIDLRSYTLDDAQRYLANAKLKVTVTGKYDKAPKGTVIAQTPIAGSKLPVHATIALVVSKGENPVHVPDIIRMSLADATTALARTHLHLNVSGKTETQDLPPDVIASQDPAAGATSDPNGTVNVVVSTGPSEVAVPDVGGEVLSDAGSEIASAGLQPRFSFITQAGGVVGAVIGQLPVAGERVPHGSTVVLSISVPGTVPDVSGMPLERARAALQNAGYRIGNIAQTQEGDSGRVVRTEPGANADFKAGSSVTIYYNGAIVTPEPGSSPH